MKLTSLLAATILGVSAAAPSTAMISPAFLDHESVFPSEVDPAFDRGAVKNLLAYLEPATGKTAADVMSMDDETTTESSDGPSIYATGVITEIRASDLIGARVYTIKGEQAEEEWFDLDGGWRDVGVIEDLVIGRDGSVEGVTVDLGDFLGITEDVHTVRMDVLQFWVKHMPDDEGDFIVVISERVARELIEG